MPEFAWVVLPLAVALALAGVLALRGRGPSRHTLNVVSSLLLIGYVATTAGLGIFWVANQQLPVFDWHYLFGYATLVLLAVHLTFNFRVVWRWLVRGRATPAAPSAPAHPPAPATLAAAAVRARRRFAGVLGAGVAASLAYALGRLHGRGDAGAEGREVAGAGEGAGAGAADAGAGSDAALAFVERFHAASSTSRAGVLLRLPGVDWGQAPPAFKPDAGMTVVSLPAPANVAAGARIDLAALGGVLWHTAGITADRAGLVLRASPSAGALFATELYVQARGIDGLAPGPWRYDARAHALRRIGAPAAEGAATLADAAGDGALRDVPVLVVATAVLRRSGHKYGDRCYRYVLADLGHALENLDVAAAALGLRAQPVARFDESRCAAALRIDEAEEGVLALWTLHAAAQAPESPRAEPAWHAAPPGAARAALGLTAQMHRASSLRVAGAAAAPVAPQEAPAPARDESAATSRSATATATRSTAAPSAAAPSPAAIVLPPAPPAAADRLAVIAARRSVRRFARTPLPLAALAGVLQAMHAPGRARLSPAVRIDVVVNAVAGLAPGAYHYAPQAHVLRPRRTGVDLRAAARAAALDQNVIGEAAAVFVLSIDRAAFAADASGPARGYRHAFVEAGRAGERLYLEAGARALAACAVGAFHDDEAAALIGADPAREWVVHFAALGWPAG